MKYSEKVNMMIGDNEELRNELENIGKDQQIGMLFNMIESADNEVVLNFLLAELKEKLESKIKRKKVCEQRHTIFQDILHFLRKDEEFYKQVVILGGSDIGIETADGTFTIKITNNKFSLEKQEQSRYEQRQEKASRKKSKSKSKSNQYNSFHSGEFGVLNSLAKDTVANIDENMSTLFGTATSTTKRSTSLCKDCCECNCQSCENDLGEEF